RLSASPLWEGPWPDYWTTVTPWKLHVAVRTVRRTPAPCCTGRPGELQGRWGISASSPIHSPKRAGQVYGPLVPSASAKQAAVHGPGPIAGVHGWISTRRNPSCAGNGLWKRRATGGARCMTLQDVINEAIANAVRA